MASQKFQNKVGKVMGEFKGGDLKSGGSGKTVQEKKQAIAIALQEGRKATGTNPYPMAMNNLNGPLGPQLPKMGMNIGPMPIPLNSPSNENPAKISQLGENLGVENKNYDPLAHSYSALRAAVRRKRL